MKLHDRVSAAKESKLAAMLLDPEGVPDRFRGHVEECEGCGQELDELKATMALLDTWESPEPSPYFMTRLEARLREESQAAQSAWLNRKLVDLRAGFAYGQHIHVRPLAAMALSIALLLGGGAYLDLTYWEHAVARAQQTAVVHDLQTMENNAQLLDQLEALSNTTSNNEDGN